jgi:hypothetical protein
MSRALIMSSFALSSRLWVPSSRPGIGDSLSIIGHFRELSGIRACARDLPSPADPERDVVGANRPNFANPLCARFAYVRPHAIRGVPIGGSERSRAEHGEAGSSVNASLHRRDRVHL